jgi:small-conductance mechanosensitive channel
METEETTTTETEVTSTDEALGDAGKRALEAERKARAAAEKRAREAEAKVKQAEDADKTEVERLQAQVAELSKIAEAATAKADRFEVAAEKGLSLAQARRLVGSTKEELAEDADALRADLGLDKDEDKDDAPAPATKARPTEDLKLGASNVEDEQPNAAKLADSILKSSF